MLKPVKSDSNALYFFVNLDQLSVQSSLSGQIFLDNASFEGEPQDATTPVGWLPCERGTTPDILPGPWGVYQEASDGDTYVGLITRDDGTWESIGQRLKQTLQPKDCYTFFLDLAHSNTYAGIQFASSIENMGRNYPLCQKISFYSKRILSKIPIGKHMKYNFM